MSRECNSTAQLTLDVDVCRVVQYIVELQIVFKCLT